jgi:anti-sigma factor RsiW
MNCREVQELIHGYVDGELDLVRNLETERHLHECAACAGIAERLRALRSGLSGSLPYFHPPAGLEGRIRAELRAGDRPPARAPYFGTRRHWIAIAAALLLAVGGVLQVVFLNHRYGAEILAREALASHVRSLMASHLTDVPSSDRHTVKPWFNGKVDFSPAVNDLANRGFPLAGGRVDYLDNRPVAALVYQRQKHVINLFVWPVPGSADSGVETSSRQGYNLLHWTRGRMAYWAVSDLNAGELESFATLVRGAP